MGDLVIAASQDHMVQPWEWKRQQTDFVIQSVLEVAKKPAVSFSGGLHSSLLLREIRKFVPDILVYTIDIRLGYPSQDRWVAEFARGKGLNYRVLQSTEWTTDDEFMLNGIVFKGLQHVPTQEWHRLRINNACRGVRQKWDKKLLREEGVDYVFTGILGDEKPIRKRWWLESGYVKERSDGRFHVKPIAHWTLEDCKREALSGQVEYPEDIYNDCGNFRQGDMGCWMCSVRMKDPDRGNFGFLKRNNPDLWDKVMYEHDGAGILRNIQDAYPKSWLSRFINEYL